MLPVSQWGAAERDLRAVATEAVGYQSEAAFQRAFKSHMGVTPAQWRKMQEPAGQDVFAGLTVPGDANPIRADNDIN
jgi:AraC family transcriptional activator of mtrCDE